MRLLFLGDVVGRCGRKVVAEELPGLIARYKLDFVVLNGENAAGGFGITEAILGAFFFGIFWNISEVISEEVGWLITTLFVKLGITIFLLIFSFAVKQQIGWTDIPAKTKSMIVLMGIIEVGAVALVNYGLTIGDALLITPIASALSIVTIALAVIFLKDKLSKLQGLGIITAIAGIIATAF